METSDPEKPLVDVRAIRRVVTGLDPTARSTVLSDEVSPHVRIASEFIRYTELWTTPSAPPDDSGTFADAADIPIALEPSDPHGTMCRICEYDPDPPGTDLTGMMHATRTVDYVLVLSGRISCLYEDGTRVDLQPGDFLVQRGTKHVWSNAGPESCVFLCMTVGARDHGGDEAGWRPETESA